MHSRRNFVQSAIVGGLGLAMSPAVARVSSFIKNEINQYDDLYMMADDLLLTWVDALQTFVHK